MKILFLGDIVGDVGCFAIKSNISRIIKDKKIDFVVVNGENSFGIKKKLLIILKKRKDY